MYEGLCGVTVWEGDSECACVTVGVRVWEDDSVIVTVGAPGNPERRFSLMASVRSFFKLLSS